MRDTLAIEKAALAVAYAEFYRDMLKAIESTAERIERLRERIDRLDDSDPADWWKRN